MLDAAVWPIRRLARARYAAPIEHHHQVDRNDLERQQIAGHSAAAQRIALGEPVGADADQTQPELLRRLPWRRFRSRRPPAAVPPAIRLVYGGPLRPKVLSAACNSTANRAPPTTTATTHCPAPVFIETNGPRAVNITPKTNSTIVPPT